jgi:autotransporter-associated beta strand protein
MRHTTFNICETGSKIAAHRNLFPKPNPKIPMKTMKSQSQKSDTPAHFHVLRLFKPIAAAVALILAGLPSISRADATWVGDTSQDWNNAANWSSDPANPTGSFFVNTNTAGIYPIVSTASAFSPVDIIIGDGVVGGASNNGRLDQTAGSLATGGGNWLMVGRNGTGTYNLTGGTLTAGAIHMARTTGTAVSTGTVNVTNATVNTTGGTVIEDGNNVGSTCQGTLNLGSGATLNSENDLLLAFAGNASSFAEVNISAGATVNVATATKRWLIVSQWDLLSGRLNVNGGTVNLNANTDLRFSTGNNSGANVVNLNSGAITSWSGNQTGSNTTAVVDLNNNSGAANNTFNLNGGTLTINQIITGNDGGTAAFNFNGGTLKAAGSTANFIQLGGGSQTANVLDGGAIIDSAGFDVAIPQMLLGGGTGVGGLTKIGNGTLTLSGGYTYTGPTAVRGGTLALDAAQSSSSSTALTVSNAALTISLNNGASSLYAGGVSLAGSNVLNFNFGTATSPSARAIDASGYSVSNTGTNIINITGPLLAVGTYPLIYTGGSVPTNNFKLGPLPTGMVAKLVNSGTSLDLQITSAGQSLFWYGADSVGNVLTNWDIDTSANWNTGTKKYLQYSGNTYGDNVTFDDTVFSGSTSINLGVRVVPSTVMFNSSQTYSITGTGGIDGAVAVVVTNTGSVFLGTSNNYMGGTFIGGGTLAITNDSALGTNTGVVALMGGTLQFDANAANSRAITVTANSGIGVAAGATVQFSGSVTGSASVTKSGDGELNLPAPNAISVVASVSAGVIKLSNANAVTNGNIGPNIDNGVIFNSGIGTFNVGGLNGASVLDLTDTASSPVKLSVGGNNSSSTFSGSLTGAGSLVKVGTGTLTLNGAGTYTGGTFVSAGVLAAGDAVSPGSVTPFGTGNITVTNGSVLYLGTTVANAFASYQYPNNITVDNGSVYAFDSSQRVLGNLQIGPGGAAIGSTFDAPWEGFSEPNFPKALFFDGLVTGTGNLTVQDKGEQTGNPWNTSCAVFTSDGTAAQNTYSGTVTVNPFASTGGSYLYLVGTNVLANATITLTGDNPVSSGRMGISTLLFGDGNVDGPGYCTIGGLAGSGSLLLADTILFTGGTGYSNGIPVALTVGYNNASTTYSGVLSGPGSLIKVGTGTLTLSGANTYTGDTTVRAGTLELAQPNLASGSTVAISSGAALRLNFATTNRVSVLVLNGVNTPVGVYSSSTASPYITGTGSLLVQPIATNPTNITFSVSGNTLSLSWPSDHLGWILQQQTNSLSVGLGTNWIDVPGSSSITSTNITVNSALPTVFYRLRQP